MGKKIYGHLRKEVNKNELRNRKVSRKIDGLSDEDIEEIHRRIDEVFRTKTNLKGDLL